MYSLKRQKWSTNMMVKISTLAVIGNLLMFLKISVFPALPFLKLDLADLPALIGAFAMGPMAGVIIQLIKNLLHLLVPGSSTAGVGEISNFIVGSAFVYTAGLFYYKNKNFKNAIIGSIVGVLVMTLIASFSNYFVIFPMYSKLYGLPMETLISMGSKLNKNIMSLKTIIIYAVVPFNLIKGSIVSAVSIIIYKKVSPILHK